MFRLSIIVPFLGDLTRLEDTLVSVLENRPDRSQVVVVLNQPYNDPYELHDEVMFVQAPHGAGLVDCFDVGVAASDAPVVHLLAAGVEATPAWIDAAMARFQRGEVGAVAPLLIDRHDTNRILSAGLSYSTAGAIDRLDCDSVESRSIDTVSVDQAKLLGPELLAGFYRREALLSVETLSERKCGLAAAAELALSIRSAGYVSILETNSQLLASREVLQGAGAWHEGRAAEQLFGRWASLPEGKRSQIGHAKLVAMECLQIPVRPSLLARTAGRLWAKFGFSKAESKGFGRPAMHGQLDSRASDVASGLRFNDGQERQRSRAAG